MGDRELPVPNRAVHKRWLRYTASLHEEAKHHQRTTIPVTPPQQFNFLSSRSKRNQVFLERNSTIERENLLLLDKMRTIMTERQRAIEEPFLKASLNRGKRKQEMVRIIAENEGLLRRIQARRPVYQVELFEQQHAQKEKMLSQVGRFPYVSESVPNMTPPPLPTNQLKYYGYGGRTAALQNRRLAGTVGPTTLPKISGAATTTHTPGYAQSARKPAAAATMHTSSSANSGGGGGYGGYSQPSSSRSGRKVGPTSIAMSSARALVYSGSVTVEGTQVHLSVYELSESREHSAGLEFVGTTNLTDESAGASTALPVLYSFQSLATAFARKGAAGGGEEDEAKEDASAAAAGASSSAGGSPSIPLSYFNNPQHTRALLDLLLPKLTWTPSGKEDAKRQLHLRGVDPEVAKVNRAPPKGDLVHTRIHLEAKGLPKEKTEPNPPVAVLYALDEHTGAYQQVAHCTLARSSSSSSSSSPSTLTGSLVYAHYSLLDGPLRLGIFEVDAQDRQVIPTSCLGEAKWMVQALVTRKPIASDTTPKPTEQQRQQQMMRVKILKNGKPLLASGGVEPCIMLGWERATEGDADADADADAGEEKEEEKEEQAEEEEAKQEDATEKAAAAAGDDEPEQTPMPTPVKPSKPIVEAKPTPAATKTPAKPPAKEEKKASATELKKSASKSKVADREKKPPAEKATPPPPPKEEAKTTHGNGGDAEEDDEEDAPRRKLPKLFQTGRAFPPAAIELLIGCTDGAAVPPADVPSGSSADVVLFHLYYRPTSSVFDHAIPKADLAGLLDALAKPIDPAATLADQAEALLEYFTAEKGATEQADDVDAAAPASSSVTVLFRGKKLDQWKDVQAAAASSSSDSTTAAADAKAPASKPTIKTTTTSSKSSPKTSPRAAAAAALKKTEAPAKKDAGEKKPIVDGAASVATKVDAFDAATSSAAATAGGAGSSSKTPTKPKTKLATVGAESAVTDAPALPSPKSKTKAEEAPVDDQPTPGSPKSKTKDLAKAPSKKDLKKSASRSKVESKKDDAAAGVSRTSSVSKTRSSTGGGKTSGFIEETEQPKDGLDDLPTATTAAGKKAKKDKEAKLPQVPTAAKSTDDIEAAKAEPSPVDAEEDTKPAAPTAAAAKAPSKPSSAKPKSRPTSSKKAAAAATDADADYDIDADFADAPDSKEAEATPAAKLKPTSASATRPRSAKKDASASGSSVDAAVKKAEQKKTKEETAAETTSEIAAAGEKKEEKKAAADEKEPEVKASAEKAEETTEDKSLLDEPAAKAAEEKAAIDAAADADAKTKADEEAAATAAAAKKQAEEEEAKAKADAEAKAKADAAAKAAADKKVADEKAAAEKKKAAEDKAAADKKAEEEKAKAAAEAAAAAQAAADKKAADEKVAAEKKAADDAKAAEDAAQQAAAEAEAKKAADAAAAVAAAAAAEEAKVKELEARQEERHRQKADAKRQAEEAHAAEKAALEQAAVVGRAKGPSPITLKMRLSGHSLPVHPSHPRLCPMIAMYAEGADGQYSFCSQSERLVDTDSPTFQTELTFETDEFTPAAALMFSIYHVVEGVALSEDDMVGQALSTQADLQIALKNGKPLEMQVQANGVLVAKATVTLGGISSTPGHASKAAVVAGGEAANKVAFEVFVSCRKLKRAGDLPVSAMVALYEADSLGEYAYVSQTERIEDSSNPIFDTAIRLTAVPTSDSSLMFSIYHVNEGAELSADDQIGAAVTTVQALLAATEANPIKIHIQKDEAELEGAEITAFVKRVVEV